MLNLSFVNRKEWLLQTRQNLIICAKNFSEPTTKNDMKKILASMEQLLAFSDEGGRWEVKLYWICLL